VKTTLVLLAAMLAVSSCGLFGRRIGRDDCHAWSDHYREVGKAQLGKRLKKCDLDRAFERATATLDESCGHNVGMRFDEKEAACWMAGKSLADWQACGFKGGTIFSSLTGGFRLQSETIDDLCP
jgi:hypothetical protein